MAFVHGKSLYISVGGHDVSPYANKFDFPRLADTAETSTFGNTSKTYIPGLKGAKCSLDGLWDITLDGWLDGILGTEITVIYKPQGTGSGHVVYTFQAICDSYNPPGTIGDAVKYTAGFVVTGDVVRTTP